VSNQSTSRLTLIHQMSLAILSRAACDCSIDDSDNWGDSY